MQARRRRAATRGRKNRRVSRPLGDRLPSPRQLAAMSVRGLRAALPALAAFVVAGAVGAGGYYGYHWLTASEKFAIETIELSGAERVTEARILHRAGIDRGDNIFTVGLPALEQTLEGDPWIADAAVSRRLPDTLIIDIREHRPAALVSAAGLYLADAEGQIFKRAVTARGEGAGLPVVSGIPRDTLRDHPEVAAEKVREALAALAIYDAGQRPAVAEIALDPRRGVVFHTAESAMAIRVGLAAGDELAARLQLFDAAWAALTPAEQAGARVIYLDNESRPDRVTVGFGQHQKTSRDG